MTIAGTYMPDRYTGSGTTGPFGFNFPVGTDDEVRVALYNSTTFAETVLVLSTDYSVALNLDGTGSVTTIAPVTADYEIVISLDVDFIQELNLLNTDDYDGPVITRQLDLLVNMARQNNERAERSIEVGLATGAPYDFNGRRATNLDDGVADTDAVTVGQAGALLVTAAAALSAAQSAETATAADAIATAADRVQTGLDTTATAADAIATAADRVQTGLDTDATAADAVATAADRVQTGLDAAATAADVIQTAADVVSTGDDATATAADAVATAADRAQTGLDAAATAADVIAAAASAAEAAADAGLLPAITGGDAGKQLVVNSGETAFELSAAGGGGLVAGAEVMWRGATPPSGWLEEDGSAIAVASYGDLTTAIYCGDTDNPTAEWGYRCTDDADPTNTRSTTGDYIVLPDMRGEFPRGWDNGRGVDSGRSLWAYQDGAIKSHTHTGSTNSTGAHMHSSPSSSNGSGSGTSSYGTYASNTTTGSSGAHSHTITLDATGDPENLVRNAATMFIIKY